MKNILSLLAFTSVGFGATVVSSSLSSTSSSDITYYTNTAGILTAQSSASAIDPALTISLSSSAGAAGGNVELFAGSDGLTDMSSGGVFATTTPIVLNTSHAGGGSVQVRSLNGMDWFADDLMVYNLSYGANNLANVYFEDLRQAAISATTNPLLGVALNSNVASLYGQFLLSGGFAQISDPNVSYVKVDGNGKPVVGLAGFLDSSIRLQALSGLSAIQIAQAFPNGFQASEVAIVNGEALYSFNAVSSGVVLNDGQGSYTGTYEVTGSDNAPVIPEPSASFLVLLSGVGFITRRKR